MPKGKRLIPKPSAKGLHQQAMDLCAEADIAKLKGVLLEGEILALRFKALALECAAAALCAQKRPVFDQETMFILYKSTSYIAIEVRLLSVAECYYHLAKGVGIAAELELDELKDAIVKAQGEDGR